MKMFKIAAAVAVLIASPLWAEQDDNTLVIEVAGESTGTIEILLRPDVAPEHVKRIKRLAREGKYDNVVFHRVIGGFMAQTGDVQNGKRGGNLAMAGTGASEYPDLKAEFSNLAFDTGIVGMARSQSPDSANSQFFIMFEPAPSLNNQYTIVGRVAKGQDVVNAIKKGSRAANGSVKKPDYMARVRVKSDIK